MTARASRGSGAGRAASASRTARFSPAWRARRAASAEGRAREDLGLRRTRRRAGRRRSSSFRGMPAERPIHGERPASPSGAPSSPAAREAAEPSSLASAAAADAKPRRSSGRRGTPAAGASGGRGRSGEDGDERENGGVQGIRSAHGSERLGAPVREDPHELVLEEVVLAADVLRRALVVDLPAAFDVVLEALVEIARGAPLVDLLLVVELDLRDEESREAARVVERALRAPRRRPRGRAARSRRSGGRR